MPLNWAYIFKHRNWNDKLCHMVGEAMNKQAELLQY